MDKPFLFIDFSGEIYFVDVAFGIKQTHQFENLILRVDALRILSRCSKAINCNFYGKYLIKCSCAWFPKFLEGKKEHFFFLFIYSS